MRRWHPPSILIWAVLGLLVLLGLTITLAYQPLGAFNTPIALTIATTKALIVAAIFMELRERRSLIIAFASAGFFWLTILFWLAATDFITRPQFPPKPPGAEVSLSSSSLTARASESNHQQCPLLC